MSGLFPVRVYHNPNCSTSRKALDAARASGRPVDLGLTDPNASDAAILDAMVADPVLVERPIVETEKGAVLARPIEKIDEVL